MTEKIIMTAGDIERSLDRIALEIIERNRGLDELSVIGIHTGGVFVAEHLKRRLEAHGKGLKLPSGNLDITLYRDDWSLIAQNPVVKKSDIGFLMEDRRVILVDDVLFTGRTIRAALDAIMDYGRPLGIQLAVLVDRGGRELPIQPDYVGMTISAAPGERVDALWHESGEPDRVRVDAP